MQANPILEYFPVILSHGSSGINIVIDAIRCGYVPLSFLWQGSSRMISSHRRTMGTRRNTWVCVDCRGLTPRSEVKLYTYICTHFTYKGHRRRTFFIARDERFYILWEIAYMRTWIIFVGRDLSVAYARLEKKISKHRTRAIFVARDKNILSIVVNIQHVWFFIFVSCDKKSLVADVRTWAIFVSWDKNLWSLAIIIARLWWP